MLYHFSVLLILILFPVCFLTFSRPIKKNRELLIALGYQRSFSICDTHHVGNRQRGEKIGQKKKKKVKWRPAEFSQENHLTEKAASLGLRKSKGSLLLFILVVRPLLAIRQNDSCWTYHCLIWAELLGGSLHQPIWDLSASETSSDERAQTLSVSPACGQPAKQPTTLAHYSSQAASHASQQPSSHLCKLETNPSSYQTNLQTKQATYTGPRETSGQTTLGKFLLKSLALPWDTSGGKGLGRQEGPSVNDRRTNWRWRFVPINLFMPVRLPVTAPLPPPSPPVSPPPLPP